MMNLTILYIEENIEEKYSVALLENITKHYLFPWNCLFTVVRDGFSGLECLQCHHYDLLILQKEIPFLNAKSFCQILTQLHIQLPIILLSNVQEESGYLEITSNPVFVLPKPFTVKQLCQVIEYAVNISSFSVSVMEITLDEMKVKERFEEELTILTPQGVQRDEEDLEDISHYEKEDKKEKESTLDRLFGWELEIHEISSIADSYSDRMIEDYEEEDGNFVALANEPMLEESETCMKEWSKLLNASFPKLLSVQMIKSERV